MNLSRRGLLRSLVAPLVARERESSDPFEFRFYDFVTWDTDDRFVIGDGTDLTQWQIDRFGFGPFLVVGRQADEEGHPTILLLQPGRGLLIDVEGLEEQRARTWFREGFEPQAWWDEGWFRRASEAEISASARETRGRLMRENSVTKREVRFGWPSPFVAVDSRRAAGRCEGEQRWNGA